VTIIAKRDGIVDKIDGKRIVVKAAENCIRLFPSLLSTTDELDMGIKIIKKTCEEMS